MDHKIVSYDTSKFPFTKIVQIGLDVNYLKFTIILKLMTTILRSEMILNLMHIKLSIKI